MRWLERIRKWYEMVGDDKIMVRDGKKMVILYMVEEDKK